MPLLVRWPGRIKPGVSDALVGQIDFLASLAVLVSQKLPASEARDSRNELPALLGDAKTGREDLVEHVGTLAIRDGTWKYIEPGRGARLNPSTNTEMGNDPVGQLYELGVDLAETKNLIEHKPEKARELVERLNATRAAGRLPTSSAGKQ